MSGEPASREPLGRESFGLDSADRTIPPNPFRQLLQPLASLKLTVTLFALSLFLVLAGTLAQVEADIWEVVRNYFRAWICWIDLRMFFPMFRMFPELKDRIHGLDPKIGLWYPGGLTIGSLMFVNLLAAHALRFRVQATGLRLVSGAVALAAGSLAMWLVIDSGHSAEGLQEAGISWDGLWSGMKWLVAALVVLNAAALALRARQSRSEAWLLTGTLAALGAALAWLIFGADRPFSAPTMRILWQLLKAELAAVALIPGCVLLFRKRAGIVLLHLGVGLVMVNEIVVAVSHVETRMSFFEGDTLNYAEDIRETELVLIDSSQPEYDEVISIPVSRLESAANGPDAVIRDPQLPFDVQVVKFLKNSQPENDRPGQDNLATAGTGLDIAVREIKPVAGTDSDGGIDLNSVYVRLTDPQSGTDRGTFLASVWFEVQSLPGLRPNTVRDSSGTEWRVALRFRRYEKPYSVTLIDTVRTDYVGTATPMDYRSIVRLVDPGRNADLERPIWMNNPLRYAGDTFYQSGHDVIGGREKSTLSVVQNTGWMIPYVACMVVATGMLMQFWLTLVRFLGRSRSRKQAGRNRSVIEKAFPWTMAVFTALYFLSKVRMPSAAENQPDLFRFGTLPVIYEGRSQPLDTVARNSLRILCGRDTFRSPDGTRRIAAMQWLFDLMVDPDQADRHRVIRIDHPQIRGSLKLDLREGHTYSMSEIEDRLPDLREEVEAAQHKDPEQRTVEERKLVDLLRKVQLYRILQHALTVPQINDATFDEDARFAAMLGFELQNAQAPRLLPPVSGIPRLENEWLVLPLAGSIFAAKRDTDDEQLREQLQPTRLMLEIIAAGRKDPATFNSKVREYQVWLAEYQRKLDMNPPEDPRLKALNLARSNFEAFYNQFAPFWYATFAYLFAFVLAAAGLLGWSRTLNRASFLVIATTLVLHTFALGARIYISDRPPVTNLYSSAVFIGWGGVILGMIFESIYRLGIGNLMAGVLGAATLGISIVLETDGDTFKVLQAVLDTQFWLATHVTCITLGYSTTFLAGLLGIAWVLIGLLTPWLNQTRRLSGGEPVLPESSERQTPAALSSAASGTDRPSPLAAAAVSAQTSGNPLGKELTRMIYGTVCFGIFFSFVGTVLGGLWADDSWGRFWGWDPKENGALMIVLWNALLLHARWGKIVGDRGLAVLAIGGNIVTSWSWFGVNELGVGLHSYGFTEGVWSALCFFWLSQVLLMVAGVTPKRCWWSFRTSPSET